MKFEISWDFPGNGAKSQKKKSIIEMKFRKHISLVDERLQENDLELTEELK